MYLYENASTDEADESEYKEAVDKYIKKFEEAMEDDFITADAISAVFELVKYINQNVDDNTAKNVLKLLIDNLAMLCDILGIILKKEEKLLDADIEKMIEERQQARKNKDFATADRIRDELLSKGIVLEDTREGVKYKWL